MNAHTSHTTTCFPLLIACLSWILLPSPNFLFCRRAMIRCLPLLVLLLSVFVVTLAQPPRMPQLPEMPTGGPGGGDMFNTMQMPGQQQQQQQGNRTAMRTPIRTESSSSCALLPHDSLYMYILPLSQVAGSSEASQAVLLLPLSALLRRSAVKWAVQALLPCRALVGLASLQPLVLRSRLVQQADRC